MERGSPCAHCTGSPRVGESIDTIAGPVVGLTFLWPGATGGTVLPPRWPCGSALVAVMVVVGVPVQRD